MTSFAQVFGPVAQLLNADPDPASHPALAPAAPPLSNHSAIRSNYPNSTIHGCLSHLKKQSSDTLNLLSLPTEPMLYSDQNSVHSSALPLFRSLTLKPVGDCSRTTYNLHTNKLAHVPI